MHQEIIDFWFSPEASKRWFDSTPEFDQLLCERYQSVWEEASRGELDDWMATAEGCLALVIVLDQLPLNMFRGEAKSFSTEARSIDVARHAVEHGFDAELPIDQVSFLYMPFMHSENLDDQNLCVKLFDKPGLEGNLRFAYHHRGIIEKFGRFPHRNEILGRESTDAEMAYLNSKEAFTG